MASKLALGIAGAVTVATIVTVAAVNDTGTIVNGTGTVPTGGTHNAPTARTGGIPPYFHVDAPEWCDEDMICWIGSNADGRSTRAVLADWDKQLRVAYAR